MSAYGLAHLSALLRMESKRTMANIGQISEVAEQNRQQFIRDSPWSAAHLIERLASHRLARRERYS